MLYLVPNVHQLIQIYIVLNIWKHHFTVKITLGAILGVSDTSFLPQNKWFLLFYVILHLIMVWNGHKMFYIVSTVHQLIQIYTVFNIWKHHFAVKITFGAIFEVSNTSCLPHHQWFLSFYVILHPIMVWNDQKVIINAIIWYNMI